MPFAKEFIDAVQGLRPGFYAEQSQRLLSHFPNSYAHELPGCHFAFKYQPKMVANLLESILAQQHKSLAA